MESDSRVNGRGTDLEKARSEFYHEKRTILSQKEDFSRKGSIDAPIVDLINKVNRFDEYCTTSSCSGRIVIFAQPSPEFCDTRQHELNGDAVDSATEQVLNYKAKKRGCNWLHVTHDLILRGTVQDIIDLVQRNCDEILNQQEKQMIVLKFEPFILHVRAATIEGAKSLMVAGISSGEASISRR